MRKPTNFEHITNEFPQIAASTDFFEPSAIDFPISDSSTAKISYNQENFNIEEECWSFVG